jgi:hypothetical protein
MYNVVSCTLKLSAETFIRILLLPPVIFFRRDVSLSKTTMKFSFQFMLLTELTTLPTKSNLLHTFIVSEFRDTGKATTIDSTCRFKPNVSSLVPVLERSVSPISRDPRAGLAVLFHFQFLHPCAQHQHIFWSLKQQPDLQHPCTASY